MCRVEISFTCYSSLEVLFFFTTSQRESLPNKIEGDNRGRNIAGLGRYLPTFAACVFRDEFERNKRIVLLGPKEEDDHSSSLYLKGTSGQARNPLRKCAKDRPQVHFNDRTSAQPATRQGSNGHLIISSSSLNAPGEDHLFKSLVCCPPK